MTTTSEPTSEKPPAYFLSLTVENFRCFGPKQTLDLSDGNGRPARWTVLLGDNGVGKTSILQLIISSYPVFIQDRDHEGKILDEGCFVPLAFSWHDWSTPLTDIVNYFRFKKNVSVDVYVGDFDNNVDISDIPSENRSFGMSNYSDDIVGLSSIESWLYPFSQNLLYGYGATRRMGKRAISDYENKNPFLSIFDDSVDLLNAEEWLVISDYATKIGSAEKTTKAEVRLNKIKNLLVSTDRHKGLLPDVEDFRFTTTDDSKMTPRVEAKTPYGWVRVRDLSLGYQTALAWIVDFASRMFERYPNSENPLAEPAIVLVDEIDLHLHPKWQRQLLKMLSDTFPNTQFIVTAHSPLIVQAAPNANLALLRREGDHVVIENNVDHIRKWRVDQILASELFEEQPVYPPETEDLLAERTRILSKSRLAAKDKARVAAIDAEIDKLPSAARPADREAMDLIRETAKLLRAKKGE